VEEGCVSKHTNQDHWYATQDIYQLSLTNATGRPIVTIFPQ